MMIKVVRAYHFVAINHLFGLCNLLKFVSGLRLAILYLNRFKVKLLRHKINLNKRFYYDKMLGKWWILHKTRTLINNINLAYCIRFSYAPTLASSKQMFWHHFGAINVWRFLLLPLPLCDFILFPRHRRCNTHFHFACIYRIAICDRKIQIRNICTSQGKNTFTAETKYYYLQVKWFLIHCPGFTHD